MDNEFFTANEAARLLKVSPETLKKWRVKKIGPAYSKIGRQILYSKDAISEFFQSKNRCKREVA